MNTKTMSQFAIMDTEMLDRIEGGIFGVDDVVFWTGVGSYVAGRVVDAAIDDFTNQCRKNPHQWFCVHVQI